MKKKKEEYHMFNVTVTYTDTVDSPQTISGKALFPKMGLFHNFIIIDNGKTQRAINMNYIIAMDIDLDMEQYTSVESVENDRVLADRLREIEIEEKTMQLNRMIEQRDRDAPDNMYWGVILRNKRLIDKMKSVLGNEELSSDEIIGRLKEDGYNKRGRSFTKLQISVILSKNKNFERVNAKGELAIWRNRNVMDWKV